MNTIGRRGFTLLELSIVLTLIAIIVSSGLVMFTANIQASQYNLTVARIDAIEKALLNFAIANNRIPCPGNITLTVSSTDYGKEAGATAGGTGTGECVTGMTPVANFKASSGTEEGGVPTRALQLPDDYMYDAWAHKLRYAVDPTYTATSALPATALACSTSAKAITVNDASGAARTTAAAYALISHGANGHGAYTSNGTVYNASSVNQAEQANCHCDNTGVSSSYLLANYQPSGTATGFSAATYVAQLPSIDSANSADNFDDIVAFKEPWQFQAPNFPLGAATSCSTIYVVDQVNNRVEEFSLTGTYVSKWGTSGWSAGQLGSSTVSWMAIDAQGNFWVNAATGISKFNPAGSYQGLAFGGSANGQTSGVNGIAIDTNGNIWVTDGGNNRIQEFNNSGTWLQSFGGPSPHTCQSSPAGSVPACAAGSGSGQFNNPTGIAFDQNNNFWVTNGNNSIIQKCTTSGSCTPYGSGSCNWTGGGNICAASAIAIDNNNNVWVAAFPGAQEFSNSGGYIKQITLVGPDGGPNHMYGIAVDSSNDIWISDGINNNVQEFSNSGTWLGTLSGTASACTNCLCTSGAGSCPTSSGNGNGQLNWPENIAITSGR